MMKLAAMMEPVSMNNFEARLNDERGSKAIMEQRARLVMEKMPEVYITPAAAREHESLSSGDPVFSLRGAGRVSAGRALQATC